MNKQIVEINRLADNEIHFWLQLWLNVEWQRCWYSLQRNLYLKQKPMLHSYTRTASYVPLFRGWSCALGLNQLMGTPNFAPRVLLTIFWRREDCHTFTYLTKKYQMGKIYKKTTPKVLLTSLPTQYMSVNEVYLCNNPTSMYSSDYCNKSNSHFYKKDL